LVPLILVGLFAFGLLAVLQQRGTITLTSSNSGWIYAVSIIGAGAIGGGIFLCCFNIASYLFGAALGVVISIFFLSLPFTHGWSTTIRIVIIAVCGLLGIIIGHFIKKPLLIISTAVLGSYALFSGADYFIKTGFGSIIKAIRDKVPLQMTAGMWGMLAGFLVVAIIGSAVQFRLEKNNQKSKYAPAPMKQV
jgi:hypothetical protein